MTRPRPRPAPGWVHEVMVPPSLLFGANGIRVTPAGELWITQSLGDRITSWNPATGRFTIVSGARHGMSAPDDLAFDSAARCYFSQPRDGQVSVRDPSGALAVLVDGLPEANGITVTPDDRLFVDECRSGGRLLEVSTDGSAPARTVISGIGMPNALEMGPDRPVVPPRDRDGPDPRGRAGLGARHPGPGGRGRPVGGEVRPERAAGGQRGGNR